MNVTTENVNHTATVSKPGHKRFPPGVDLKFKFEPHATVGSLRLINRTPLGVRSNPG